MNKPNKCKNCQWYGKPYWSIINPCDSCPRENDNMTIVQIDGVPVFKETLTEEQVIPDINSLQVDNLREQAKLYYEANKEEIWTNTLREKDKEIERLQKELIDITRFKNNILDDLEKRTLEVNKLRDKLKKGGKMKQELKQFDIDLDKIEENSELFDNIHEAIEKMKLYTLSDKFEVVLNNNLIESKEKLTNYRTIMGCRISYDNLDRNISFIVREDTKPSYEELENKLQQKENIIKEVRELLENDYFEDGSFHNYYKVFELLNKENT